MIKTFLLVIIWFLLTGTNCELFCNNPSIDSALTTHNQTYLFRGNHSWIFKPQNNYVSPNSTLISDIFNRVINERQVFILQIDALFSTKMLLANGGVDPNRKLIYIFYENRLYFSQSVKCKDQPNDKSLLCFGMLDAEDKKSLPPNWDIRGGPLSNWFPIRINATLRVNDTLLLFHGPYVRYVKLYTDKAWPPDEKYDIPLDGELKKISNIDAIFEMPLTEDIVITAGHKYCRFNKNQIVVKEIPKSFDISCKWNETKYLFICETPTEATTGITTNGVTETQEQSKVDTNSTTKVSIVSDETTTERKDNVQITDTKDENNYLVIIVVVLCVALLVIGTIIGIAYFYWHKSRSKTNGSNGEMAASASNPVSMTSVVTHRSEN